MERGREGRRGGTGAGSVSAPRRPRTSGFKDAPVGEDGEDVMDDVPNPRLRERPKKDSSSSVTALHGMPSGSLGSMSRNKRKRQGSQELQGQARSSTVDELDEITEDMEMGASEDDDDPPPPPISRRPGKFRLQGKSLEDGIPADLPTVPRKARTAILKRPLESPSPSVVGDATQQGFTAVSRSPAPVSAPTSSSVVSLKLGRMKPSGLKLRAAKASKVSSSTIISEQEVEVAEALFDLARMFTNQSTSSKQEVSAEINPEPKVDNNKVDPEVKLEGTAMASNAVAHPLLPPFPSSGLLQTSTAVSSPLTSPQTSPIELTASVSPLTIFSVPNPARDTLPIPAMTGPFLPVTAPPAEAPKRKRPRLKTKLEMVGYATEVQLPGSNSDASNLCGLTVATPGLEAEHISTSSPLDIVSNFVKSEGGILAPAVLTAMCESATPPAIPSSAPKNHSLEKNCVAAEMDLVKVEVTCASSSPYKKHSPWLERKLAPAGFPSPQAILTWETDEAPSRIAGNNLCPKLDLGKRPSQQLSPASVGGQPNKFDFDLMLDLPATTAAGGPSRMNKEKRQDSERQQEGEMEHEENRECENDQEREKGRETELVRDTDSEMHREEGFQIELFKDRHREKERVMEELVKQVPQQRQGKVQKLEIRAQTMERMASANATTAVSSFLAPPPQVTSTVVTCTSTCAATSAGIPSWPVGLPPMGYYSSAAAGAVWPCAASIGGTASLDENTPPGVQLQHPYVIQARHPQPWKRCASHVYIAHFIDVQQQMNGHPFIRAAFQNSGSLFGAKPYNLNIPLPPAEALFGNDSGGPLTATLSSSSGVSVAAGGGSGAELGSLPGSERNPAVTSSVANAQSNDRAYEEPLCRKQPLQQQQHSLQSSTNISLQSGPGFGFTVTQAGSTAVGGVVAASSAANGGPEGISGSGSALVGANSTSATGSSLVASLGTGNGGVVSHAVAQAQYLQAVMQQGGFPFPFQAAAHFGPSFNGPTGHIGPQQAAQFFGNPFYATHLVHPPTHTQQQVQSAAKACGGLLSGQKQQQHALQQVVRNFQPCGLQQQQLQAPVTPLSQSTSHAQQQHTLDATSPQIQQLAEREGNSLGDSNSTLESKFSNMQRMAYEEGNLNAPISTVNPPSSVGLGGGMQALPTQDFNLIAALGSKQCKQQQGQLTSQQKPTIPQQPQVASQIHANGPGLHMSLKGMDQQASQTFPAMSIATINRGSVVGPGPLGLASVAAVMAPQGHAMLHSVADLTRGHAQHQLPQHHQSVAGQSHQQSLQPGQQQLQHRGAVQQMQRATSITGLEDSRTSLNGNTFTGRIGRDAAEDRKMPTKRGTSSTSNLSKVESLDSSTAIQGTPSGGLPLPRITGSGGPTLNLLTPAPAILISRPSGHSPGSGLQQPGATPPGNQTPKQALSRSKLLTGLGGGPLVPSTQCQLASFSDRPPMGPSLPSKVQGPPLSLSGQNAPQSSQLPRQGQTSQHPQLKLSNRGSVGSLPTPSGSAPQAVLAAAIAKVQQGPQQQQSRQPPQVGTNTGSLPRLPSGNCGGTLTSTSNPLPLSKSAPIAGKSNFSSKSSFSLPHKAPSGVCSKRSVPPSVSHVTSVLGPSPLVQNLPSKSFQSQLHSQLPSQQTQQTITQYHTQPPKLAQQSLQHNPSQSSQSVMSTQYHQQQAHLSSQQLQVHNKHPHLQHQQAHQMQRHMFLPNPTFQLQQSSQVHQQTLSPSSQPQQLSCSPQIQQQPQQQQQESQLQQQQHSTQSSPGSFSAAGTNGSLPTGPPTLTLGIGSNGNTSTADETGCANVTASQGLGSRSNPTADKITSGPGTLPNSRSHVSGPSFLQAQFGSNVTSGQQQSTSPRNTSGPQYLQAIVKSEASSKLVEQKIMSDGNVQEQVNGARGLPGSSPLRMPQIPHSSPPMLQPMFSRQVTGSTLSGKSLGVQFAGNNYSEGIGSRSGLILSVAPPSLSSSNNSECPKMHSNNGNSGGINSIVHLGLDGRPLFTGSSSVTNQVPSPSPGHTGSTHQSSHSVTPGPTTSNNSQSVSQASTSTSVIPP